MTARLSEKLPTKGGKSEEAKYAAVAVEIAKANTALTTQYEKLAKDYSDIPACKTKLEARLKICKNGRAPEIKDLEKSQKRGDLYSNPSKLKRLQDDLNKEIKDEQKFLDELDEAADKHFGGAFDNTLDAFSKKIGTGTANALNLKKVAKDLRDKCKKENWADSDKKLEKAIEAWQVRATAIDAEAERTKRLNLLKPHADFKNLGVKKKFGIIEDALNEKTPKKSTVEEVKAKLREALEAQKTPSKSQWTTYLDLVAKGGYVIKPAGSFNGCAIHLTMSNDSWTGNADGKVVLEGTAASVVQALLKVKAGMQYHATLEVTKDAKKYPHAYLFAGVDPNHPRWTNLVNEEGWNAQKVAAAQKALKGVIDKELERITALVEKAIANCGSEVK